jgi:putative heme-binding domain-containing protein
MNRITRLCLLLLMVPTTRLSAEEPWVDSRLPIREGLILWLDAQAQPDAWKENHTKSQPLTDGLPFDLWFDGSENKRHLVQRQVEHQPTFRQSEGFASVRFDGENDFLANSKPGQSVEQFTIVAFAAPESNRGGFSALLGASAFGQNDYTSGLNIDQSFQTTPRLQVLNVEGAGFGGARNLISEEFPFGEFRLIEIVGTDEAIHVAIDGKRPGQHRPRELRPLALEELIVGARLYSNQAGSPFVQGFFDGEVAELLAFDRALSVEERERIEQYLLEKYEGINAAARRNDTRGGHLLESVENPPPVQMLLPGFEVFEIPLELPNINNVLYREDGALLAVAYNGNIYLIRDTDGDGLEDSAQLFWESQGRLQAPIGADLTPPNYQHGRGVFVAAKGKCTLIVDTTGDDLADKEIVIAEGWAPSFVNVDALGCAFDPRDGSVYFGLGTPNFANAYMPDESGTAQYSLESERGTILRVAPDFQSREIVCTGIRFPVAIRLNAQGDLFCTDQEGATWLPNGNPYDELLHIQKGRHYGFPPRHPVHLPGVIDEPSTFDYGPQHQSTCGLNFNEHAATGRHFGPADWKGDALIAGESRGKLYRTKLVKTAAGYVAQNQLFAGLNLLTIDAVVTPAGDLLVATHSGGPDWGSGPAGMGKLFKIRYTNKQAAQPVLAWPASERELHIAFDRSLEPDELATLTEKIRIERGEWLRAGDRFESMRPGYAVVQQQMASRRWDVPVRGMQITPDRRTLILNTDPHLKAEFYGLTLGRTNPPSIEASLEQVPETDLDYTLNGTAARLVAGDGSTRWEGWLPHVDLNVAEKFTAGSSQHEALWQQDWSGGTLTVETQLHLENMLRAEVQLGSTLDFEYPPERVTVTVSSDRPLGVLSEGAEIAPRTNDRGTYSVALTIDDPREWVPLRIDLEPTNATTRPRLEITWHTAEDDRPRPFPLHRFYVPWANETAASSEAPDWQVAALPEELDGGSWGRGRQVFFGEKAACAKCHRLGGQGGQVGPDLSNLIHRDYHSVWRDITQPSFAINPDHLTYVIALRDGRTLTGIVDRRGETLIVGDKEGKRTEIHQSEVEEMVPSAVSIMPEGIEKQLSDDQMRDLLTFLLSRPPSMPNDLDGAPDPRTRQEVTDVLAGAETAASTRPLNIVLVAGTKDHGPGEHDYPAWLQVWGDLLEAAEHVTVSRAMDWPTESQWESADGVVFYQKGTWDNRRAEDIDRFLKRGGGVSYIHYAVDGGAQPVEFANRIGLAWQGGASRFRHGELDLIFEPKHPITRNLRRVQFHDESYWQLKGDPERITLLAGGLEENVLQPLVWCREQDQGRGRVFVSIPGHFSWTFDDPLFRVLLLRGMAWSMGESVDRFNELVTPGARIR